ncbi:endonuclease domain-containing protein [Zunongwangia sp. F363]|uniref:Endonuclease domain-containing protein n=1 Tax=Autumnicola tepida TaxID=3075595 RepID=A0ABU3CA01_9FLAO|nr:endonuclease domain-containing protein [Zunongwangia sp. F363]MDT0643161.1 endonuclease domain-containing protein [Zunongwangia sp. F363]
MKKPVHNKKNLKPFRKKLRKNLTPAEAFLWKQLQDRKLEGRKFRRQHSIENFIADFYCAEEKLIIELDGQVHMNAAAEEKDLKRTAILNGLGYKVIRFENKMVFDSLSSVLQEIKDNFRNK